MAAISAGGLQGGGSGEVDVGRLKGGGVSVGGWRVVGQVQHRSLEKDR